VSLNLMSFFRTIALLAALTLTPDVWAISTILNYQGSLTDGGVPANGIYDFQFQLTDSQGNPVSAPESADDVSVIAGVFTTRLDFLDSFGGADTKLQISVRLGSSAGTYTLLSPATPIDPAPYAQVSALSESALLAVSAQTVDDIAITEPKIATGAVSTRTVSAGAITTVKIAPAAVTTSAIADGAVTAQKIASGTIGAAQLAIAAVTNTAVADGAINAQKIASFSITNAQISSGTIGTAQLAVSAVTSAEIAPNAAKLIDLDGVEGNVSIGFSLNAGVCVDQSASVPGALVGDYPVLVLQATASLPFGVTVTALSVSVANSVGVRICNFSSNSVNVVGLGVKIFTLR
jgi:hypothetical protein